MDLRKLRRIMWIVLAALNIISMAVNTYTGNREEFIFSTILAFFCIFNLWIYEKIMDHHDKKD